MYAFAVYCIQDDGVNTQFLLWLCFCVLLWNMEKLTIDLLRQLESLTFFIAEFTSIFMTVKQRVCLIVSSVIVPYALYMAILYEKCWCYLRSDYIIHSLLSYLYPILRPLNSIVGGGVQQYVLLMARSLTARRYGITREVRSLFLELTYPC